MILLDISTSYGFRAMKPMGLLRVEHEVIRAFRTLDDTSEVVFGFYDQDRGKYYKIPRANLEREVLSSTWKDRARTRKQEADPKWVRRLNALRFFWRLLKIRRQKAPAAYDEALYKQVQIAKTLADIDLHEYATVRRIFSIASRVFKSATKHIELLDLLNHQVNFGLFDFGIHETYAKANEINLSKVTRYVSVGGFWSDDRHKVGHHLRETYGATVHYLIYDLVPCLWRQVTEPTTKETFPAALHWVLWGVDQVWTISKTTQTDLEAYVESHGYPDLPRDWVKPIYLGSEIQKPEDNVNDDAILAKYGLEAGRYVLMVGTIEPRKNHEFAYRMWKELTKRHGEKVPPLVLVGQSGWHNEPFLHLIKEDAELPHDAIRLFNSVEDADLSVFYENCKFTLYPSHYEGWGLPVVESLSYGKNCLCSDAPSLIEAGQGASIHINLFDGETWLAQLETLIFNPEALKAAEDKVKRFDPIQWETFREDLITDFIGFCAGTITATDGDWHTDIASIPDLHSLKLAS